MRREPKAWSQRFADPTRNLPLTRTIALPTLYAERFLCVAAIAMLLGAIAPAATPAAEEGGGRGLGSLKPRVYVVMGGDQDFSSVVSISIAQELTRKLAEFHPPPDPENDQQTWAAAGAPWVVPEPSWNAQSLADQCAVDPQALGGVVITYYTGYASHFYLLWQSQTTTFDLYAELVRCNHDGQGGAPVTRSPAATIVGVITQLPGSDGTDWVVRRSQLSVPLITFAAIGTLIQPKGNSAKTSNLTLTALAGSILGSSGTKDIPGYSEPVRARAAAKHIGDDVIAATTALCKTAYDVTWADYQQRKGLCQSLGFETLNQPAAAAPSPSPQASPTA